MSVATYDDANLILRLYDMRREAKMREARNWFFANFQFKTLTELQDMAPMGSEPNAYFRQFTSYWDMVASFINNDVLSADLFFQSNREMLIAYLRVAPILAEAREAYKDPTYLANLEKGGLLQRDWIIEHAGQEAYDTLKARVAG